MKKISLIMLVCLMSFCSNKDDGLLLFPLSMNEVSASNNTENTTMATVEDLTPTVNNQVVATDSTLANVAVGNTNTNSAVVPTTATTQTTTTNGSTGTNQSTNDNNTSSTNTGSSSVIGGGNNTTETALDDLYMPVDSICGSKSTYTAIPKDGQTPPKNNVVNLGQYDLSMNTNNCFTGKMLIFVDFNVTGRLTKTTSFHVDILDLLGRKIGFINIQAKDAGIVKASGNITVTEPKQVILFRWDSNSDSRNKSVSTVANAVELTGVSLYVKNSEITKVSALSAYIRGPGRTNIILSIGILIVAMSALIGLRFYIRNT